MKPELKENRCEDCEISENAFQALQDTIYVIGGKWRLQVLCSVYMGNKRFREIERSIPGITTRMLSKELKLMELNNLIKRNVYPTTPVSIEYTVTEYSDSLIELIESMIDWGLEHRSQLSAKKQNN